VLNTKFVDEKRYLLKQYASNERNVVDIGFVPRAEKSKGW